MVIPPPRGEQRSLPRRGAQRCSGPSPFGCDRLRHLEALEALTGDAMLARRARGRREGTP